MSRRILKRITINRDDVAILRDQLLHVHTRNGDSIEIQFQRPSSARGKLCFGFDGGGGSRIAGPKKIGGLLARSDECRRDVPSYPMMAEPRDCLFDARIRVHDAFGYWPLRSFRASEDIAAGYLNLYRTLGGSR